MQLVCPNCAKSYRLEAASIGAAGRSVRCAGCKTVWFARPPDLRPALADAAREEAAFRNELGVEAGAASARPAEHPRASAGTAGAGEPRPQATPSEPPAPAATLGEPSQDSPRDTAGPGAAEDKPPAPADLASALTLPHEPEASPALSDIKMPAVDAPPLSPATADAASHVPTIPHEPEDIETVAARRKPARPAPPRRRAASRWKLPVLILALVAVCAAVIGWRKDIVRHAPQMASLYRLIGMPVNVRGLVFADVRIATETHDGVPVLAIEGAIASVASAAVEVPRLRFALHNAAGREVYSWTALPTQTVLGPGETLPFRSRLASPPGDMENVQVRFFNRRDAAAGTR